MKNSFLTIIFALTVIIGHSQSFNLINNLESENHSAFIQYGYDYSFSLQTGYAYKFTDRPLLLSLNVSLPAGAVLLDDFKVQFGGQYRLMNYNNFFISGELYAIFRRHETNMVTLSNIGQKSSLNIGYSRSIWSVSGEFGLDNAFITHINNKQALSDFYPAISNEWVSGTGSNAFYGLNCEVMLSKKINLYSKIGKIKALRSLTNAIIPFYFNVGVAFNF